jgi:hypothetical protein
MEVILKEDIINLARLAKSCACETLCAHYLLPRGLVLEANRKISRPSSTIRRCGDQNRIMHKPGPSAIAGRCGADPDHAQAKRQAFRFGYQHSD